MARHEVHRSVAKAERLREQIATVIDNEDPSRPVDDAELGADLGISPELARYHRIRAGIKPARERMATNGK